MSQEIINRAVKIATRSAMNGYPVRRIIWITPTCATQDSGGSFAIEHMELNQPASILPWYEK